MASLNIDVGSAANANDGATLRDAFINVRKMFAEIYGITYSNDNPQSIAGTTLAIKAAQLSNTITPASSNDGYVLTYDHSSGGFTLEQKFDGDITGIVAGNGLTGDATSGDATLNVVGGDGITANANEIEVSVDDSTIELSATSGSGTVRIKDLGVATGKIANDAVTPAKISIIDDSAAATSAHILIGDGSDFGNVAVSGDVAIAANGATTIQAGAVENTMLADNAVDHDELAARYTTIPADITTTTGTINLDCASNANFRLTGNLGTCTFNLQTMKTGQVVEVLCDGSDLSSAAITLQSTFTTENINKIGTTNFQGSKKNLFVFSCLDDTDGDAHINYTVNEVDVDDTSQP